MPEIESHLADGLGEAYSGLRFKDTVDAGGHPTTVVCDADGRVVYPSYVPPETRSPTDSSPPLPLPLPPAQQAPPQAGLGPRKAVSDPLERESAAETRPRPSVDKKYATEMAPHSSRRQSSTSPLAVKRAGTNVPRLQQPLWNPYDGDDSTSSSSSDEDAERQALDSKKKGNKKAAQPDRYGRLKVGNENYSTKAKFSKRDGRLSISVKDTSNTGYLAKALGAAVKKVAPLKEGGEADEAESRPAASSAATAALEHLPCPKLNIVIMVIGSRGDVQPFLKVGKVLREQYGHRVRIATHPAFRDFVERDSGLEFFSVGGDPSELMAFMVKNPGMIPTLETVRAGDIGRRRAAMAEMFAGFWRACINATDDERDVRNLKLATGDSDPFVADAIIANPPSFAHIHCAEALGIPLHLMFTFPYTPTQAFAHPLASIKASNIDRGYTNFMSYPLVEMMVWQGLGDLVNDFRVKSLGLDPVSTLWAPGATYRLHVPFTYMWSPSIVPKPDDWGDEVDISGFVFLDLASTFSPPSELARFLAAGEAPIYIGFGSIVVDDADRFTETIFEAVRLAGVRALVSKGWGGLGGRDAVPNHVFMLENTPHDWLFPQVRACVIHGGAGTTAMALKCGKPTMVVPFFGDQHFWGSMLERSEAGPVFVPYKHLTAENLADGIRFCLTDEAQRRAQEMAQGIQQEGDGAENACRSFHRHLGLHGRSSMRCSILEDRVAVWKLKKTHLRLSAMAAKALVDGGQISSWKKLRLIRHCEWNDFEGPGEPLTGMAGSLMSSLAEAVGGIGGVPYRLAKVPNMRRERREKKKEVRAARAKARQERAAAKATATATAHKTPEGEPEKTVGRGGDQMGAIKEQTPEATDFAGGEAHRTALPQASVAEEQDEETAQQGGNDQHDRGETASVTTAATEEENVAGEMAGQVGRGVGKTAAAIASVPADLSLAVAQGFHNAPRLYGDDTVRRPRRVTGMRSGLRAARNEFVYGVYDGFTGLVRLPVRGARDGGGVRGFAKGLGMGLTGLVLKDLAALIGPVGYTLKGVKKEMAAARSRHEPHASVRRARIAQGCRELADADADERKKIAERAVRGWDVIRSLHAAVDEADARRRQDAGLRDRLGGVFERRKKKRGLEVAATFESVMLAEEALAALRRGESLDYIVSPPLSPKSATNGEARAGEQCRKP